MDKQPSERNRLRHTYWCNRNTLNRGTVHLLVISGIVLTVTVAACAGSPVATLPVPITPTLAVPSPSPQSLAFPSLQLTLSSPTPGATAISLPGGVSFEVIAEGSAPILYRTDKAYCTVFTDPKDAPNLSELVSHAAGARLDFDRYVYVAVFHGRKPTTQYYFVAEQGSFDHGLVMLTLQLKDDGSPGELETWPYIVLAIAKTAQLQGNIAFVVKVDGGELCRMEHCVAPPSSD